MLNKLGITAAIVFLIIGLTLLFDPFSGADTNQTGRILSGATLVSLGLMTFLLVGKDWWHWRRHYKNERGQVHE